MLLVGPGNFTKGLSGGNHPTLHDVVLGRRKPHLPAEGLVSPLSESRKPVQLVEDTQLKTLQKSQGCRYTGTGGATQIQAVEGKSKK